MRKSLFLWHKKNISQLRLQHLAAPDPDRRCQLTHWTTQTHSKEIRLKPSQSSTSKTKKMGKRVVSFRTLLFDFLDIRNKVLKHKFEIFFKLLVMRKSENKHLRDPSDASDQQSPLASDSSQQCRT